MRMRNKTSKKPLIITLITVVLLTGVGVGAFFWTKSNNNSTEIPLNPQTSHVEDKIINDDAELFDEIENADQQPRPNEDNSKSLTPGNTEDASAKPLAPEIARATQDGNTIEVVAIFRSTANGSCRLTLSKPGASDITREARITVGPSYYLCGFTVENISGSGWTAAVTHLNNNQESETVTRAVQ